MHYGVGWWSGYLSFTLGRYLYLYLYLGINSEVDDACMYVCMCIQSIFHLVRRLQTVGCRQTDRCSPLAARNAMQCRAADGRRYVTFPVLPFLLSMQATIPVLQASFITAPAAREASYIQRWRMENGFLSLEYHVAGHKNHTQCKKKPPSIRDKTKTKRSSIYHDLPRPRLRDRPLLMNPAKSIYTHLSVRSKRPRKNASLKSLEYIPSPRPSSSSPRILTRLVSSSQTLMPGS